MTQEELNQVMKALKDIRTEVREPEVEELITLKADQQLDEAIEVVEKYLG